VEGVDRKAAGGQASIARRWRVGSIALAGSHAVERSRVPAPTLCHSVATQRVDPPDAAVLSAIRRSPRLLICPAFLPPYDTGL
jgi:hypothetical protein